MQHSILSSRALLATCRGQGHGLWVITVGGPGHGQQLHATPESMGHGIHTINIQNLMYM